MKPYKNLGKEIGFHVLLLVGGTCFIFVLHLSSPHSFRLRNLKWKMQEPSTHHIYTSTDQQPNQTNSLVNIETNTESVKQSTINTSTESVKQSTNDTSTESVKQSTNDSNGDGVNEKYGEVLSSKPVCDYSDWRSDICNMTGDIRTKGYNSSTIFFIPPVHTFVPKEQKWILMPYSKKLFSFVKHVTIQQLQDQHNAPPCTIHRKIPAIVLSTGGPASNNYWHAFADFLIPLFIASKPFDGEVQFLASSYNQRLINKHSLILRNLTRYEIINFDEDREIYCYPHIMVGLLSHGEFSIDPDRSFDRFDMFRFRLYVRNIYSLPADVDIPYKIDPRPDKRPRLMLILRSNYRKLLNQEEVAEVITNNGFELVQIEPKESDNITDMSKLVDSCDVLMGVHGAGLTNMLFLRTNAVMIQVIPLGGNNMTGAANGYLNKPAKEMKLRTLSYNISVEESSLLDKYGYDHPVIKDPEGVADTGWQAPQRYYWLEQDVRLNVTRFEPVLVKALELLKE